MVTKSKEAEYVKEYNKRWYAANKEIHLINCAKKVYCDNCKHKLNANHLNRHKRTNKHIKNVGAGVENIIIDIVDVINN